MRRACVGTKVPKCGHGLPRVDALLMDRVHRRRPSTYPRYQPSPRWVSASSAARVRQNTLDRDVVVSVLEASATRRDAKDYLQKYAPKARSLAGPGEAVGERHRSQTRPNTSEPANIAIMSLKAPHNLNDKILRGIAKTLTQLRALGLLSIIVLDCGNEGDRVLLQDQALRLCEAIDTFGKPGVKLATNIVQGLHQDRESSTQDQGQDQDQDRQENLRVQDHGLLERALRNDMMVVVPSLASYGETLAPQPCDPHRLIIALTEYLDGSQSKDAASSPKIASIERIIVLDALGGTPVPGRPGVCQRFVNLEQEYDAFLSQFDAPDGVPSNRDDNQAKRLLKAHLANLKLAKDALWRLPATSSALITSPSAAANCLPDAPPSTMLAMNDARFEFDGMATTRKKQNPLLHNLLTDRPVFSSSLPIRRIQAGSENYLHPGESIDATLVKRGMPLTIYPDPASKPWAPPRPGSQRLRLTDSCIDLPRLVNLIEDSFGRKLDVDAYLRRVQESLAGIIIAGEYEGGAILTWERPEGIDDEEAYSSRRHVPYLDKFAVLKSRQGSGGVADMVFNAMVWDCFPRGVCWRSRKNNPVNKWYFERSTGSSKLSDSNWAMFWTTPGLDGKHQTLQDYESVCREIVPSWADNHHVLD